ncbi:MAG TPA: CYTH domain-containing protein [Kofleriaceae bacterium]|nr:CYTH domain-containing protein [Kofleriaceae bacterium]
MGREIERKFLVDVGRWRPRDEGVLLVQGYLSSAKERVVRVRIEGTLAKLTIKGINRGITRSEFEYDIPFDDARAMLAICEYPLLEKRRHREVHDGKLWEIDVFGGENEGLVLAELELAAEDEAFTTPPWITQEVSDDARYYNANLVHAPFKSWT